MNNLFYYFDREIFFVKEGIRKIRITKELNFLWHFNCIVLKLTNILQSIKIDFFLIENHRNDLSCSVVSFHFLHAVLLPLLYSYFGGDDIEHFQSIFGCHVNVVNIFEEKSPKMGIWSFVVPEPFIQSFAPV